MKRRLILFLVRRKLRLRKAQKFQFEGQKSDAVYWFANEQICKLWKGKVTPSGVSLNWLLNDKCKIIKIGDNK